MKRALSICTIAIIISLTFLWLYSDFYTFDTQKHTPVTLIAKERIGTPIDDKLNPVINIPRNTVTDEIPIVNK